MPVEPSDPSAFARCAGGNAELADVPGHLCEVVVSEHGNMAEHVVEAVRRLEIIELLPRTDEVADRKHALGQHRKEDVVRHQSRDRDRPPAGPGLEDRVEALDVRDARMGQAQKVDPVEEG